MNFNIETKTLKGIIEKASSVSNKKSSIIDFHTVYFKVDNDGKLIVICQGINEQIRMYHSLKSKEFSIGEVGIDIDDINIITKLKGAEVSFRTIDKDDSIASVIITCGKRKVELLGTKSTLTKSYDWNDYKIFMEINTDWFVNTIYDLYPFTAKEDSKYKSYKETLKTYNFDFKHNRIEALDNYRLTIKNFNNDQVDINVNDKGRNNMMIPNTCYSVLKKIKKIKSETVSIIESDKYIHISGLLDEGVFEYSCEKIEGNFPNTQQMLLSAKNNKLIEFIGDTKDMVDILDYNKNFNVKNKFKPMIFEKENDNSFAITYVNGKGIKISDSLKVTIKKCNDENFKIGLNSQFLDDCFKILKNSLDGTFYAYSGEKKIFLIIEHNDYTFLIMSVKISNTENEEVA